MGVGALVEEMARVFDEICGVVEELREAEYLAEAHFSDVSVYVFRYGRFYVVVYINSAAPEVSVHLVFGEGKVRRLLQLIERYHELARAAGEEL